MAPFRHILITFATKIRMKLDPFLPALFLYVLLRAPLRCCVAVGRPQLMSSAIVSGYKLTVLFQRLSVALQRGNAALLLDRDIEPIPSENVP